jgi:hypothetical protein
MDQIVSLKSCAECHRWQLGFCLLTVFSGGAPIVRLTTEDACDEIRINLKFPIIYFK